MTPAYDYRGARERIFAHSTATIMERALLLALVEHAPRIEPSTARLAQMLGTNERQVRRLLATVTDKGLLRVVHRPGARSSYELILDANPGRSVLPTPDPPSSPADPDPGRCVLPPRTVRPPTPDGPSSPPRTVRPPTPDGPSPEAVKKAVSREEDKQADKKACVRARTREDMRSALRDHHLEGYSRRFFSASGVPASLRADASSVAIVLDWVPRAAEQLGLDPLVVDDRLLDGFFASPRARDARWRHGWLAQDPAEFMPARSSRTPHTLSLREERDKLVAELRALDGQPFLGQDDVWRANEIERLLGELDRRIALSDAERAA